MIEVKITEKDGTVTFHAQYSNYTFIHAHVVDIKAEREMQKDEAFGFLIIPTEESSE